VSEPPLLGFPTDYPIKVVAEASARLRAEIDAIVARHVPDFDPSRTTERASVNGRFVSLSYRIRAVSAEQVEALAAELGASQWVLLVL
jgi:uncharacterized protein